MSNFKVNIGETWKDAKSAYVNINGSWQELKKVYKWKRYEISDIPSLKYVSTSNCTYTKYDAGYTFIMNTDSPNELRFGSGAYDSILFSNDYGCIANQIGYIVNNLNTFSGYYVPLNDDLTLAVYNSSTTSWVDTVCNYVLKITGQYTANGELLGLKGEVYEPSVIVEDYVDSVYSKTMSDYPVYGAQNGYWYVYDGEITWDKYSINQIYEPSSFGSSSTKYSSGLSFPILMASQAKKDGDGNVDWGDTYSATSLSNILSNYSKYPYTSLTSSLSADTLYKITIASYISVTYKPVTGWGLTDESVGDLISSVSGKVGDYPDNGIQDGYWYIQNSELKGEPLIYVNIDGAWYPELSNSPTTYTWKKYTVTQKYTDNSVAGRYLVDEGYTSHTTYPMSDYSKGQFLVMETPSVYHSIDIDPSTGSLIYTGTPTSFSTVQSWENHYQSFINGDVEYEDFKRWFVYDGIRWIIDSAVYNTSGVPVYLMTTIYSKPILTDTKGDYIEDVTSKTSDAYPTNGVKDGYWYVQV